MFPAVAPRSAATQIINEMMTPTYIFMQNRAIVVDDNDIV